MSCIVSSVKTERRDAFVLLLFGLKLPATEAARSSRLVDFKLSDITCSELVNTDPLGST